MLTVGMLRALDTNGMRDDDPAPTIRVGERDCTLVASAMDVITANEGNDVVAVRDMAPWGVAYAMTYGIRQSSKDVIAGKGGDKGPLAQLHRVVKANEASTTQKKQFEQWAKDLGTTVANLRKMDSEEFATHACDHLSTERVNAIVAGDMQPTEERTRLKGDAKMARDIATLWVKQAYEKAGKKVSADSFAADVLKIEATHAAQIKKEVERRKALTEEVDLGLDLVA